MAKGSNRIESLDETDLAKKATTPNITLGHARTLRTSPSTRTDGRTALVVRMNVWVCAAFIGESSVHRKVKLSPAERKIRK
uniref:Uncharacterized protein n=1 Tax=Globodera rostochiensis TaxID=31243 RepID=A0A914GYV9_GLORO